MKVKDLKEKLKNVLDDVEISISDMENVEIFDFEVSTYHNTNQKYLEFIMPIYIEKYTFDK